MPSDMPAADRCADCKGDPASPQDDGGAAPATLKGIGVGGGGLSRKRRSPKRRLTPARGPPCESSPVVAGVGAADGDELGKNAGTDGVGLVGDDAVAVLEPAVVSVGHHAGDAGVGGAVPGAAGGGADHDQLVGGQVELPA